MTKVMEMEEEEKGDNQPGKLTRAVEEEQGEVILLLLRDPRIDPNQQVFYADYNMLMVLMMLAVMLMLLLRDPRIDPNQQVMALWCYRWMDWIGIRLVSLGGMR